MASRIHPFYLMTYEGEMIFRQEYYWVLQNRYTGHGMYGMGGLALLFSTEEKAFNERALIGDEAAVVPMFWEEVVALTAGSEFIEAAVDYDSEQQFAEIYLPLNEDGDLDDDDPAQGVMPSRG